MYAHGKFKIMSAALITTCFLHNKKDKKKKTLKIIACYLGIGGGRGIRLTGFVGRGTFTRKD